MSEVLTSNTTGRPAADARLMYAGRGARDAARALIAVLIAIYLDALGFSTFEIGAVLAISVVGGLALSVAVMSGRAPLSHRTWFVTLAAVTGASGLLLIFTDNIYLLGLGAFFGSYAASGMHLGPLVQLEQTGLADLVPAARRTKAFSYLSMSSAGGRAAGSLLVGIATYLINIRDFDLVDAYRVMFGVYAGLNFLTAMIYAGLSPAIETGPGSATALANPLRTKSRGRIARISALFGLDSFAGGMMFDTFVAFWLFTKFGVNEGVIGGAFVATQLVNVVSLWLAPHVARRVGLLNTFVWTQVVSNLTLIAFAFAPTAPVAIGLWVLRGLFDEMDVPTRQSYSMAIVPPEERAAMAGANNLGRSIGRVPASTVTGALWSGALTPAPWLVGAALKLTYNAAIYLTFRGVKPPEEEAGHE